jgi:hypothetical protein
VVSVSEEPDSFSGNGQRELFLQKTMKRGGFMIEKKGVKEISEY